MTCEAQREAACLCAQNKVREKRTREEWDNN